MEKFKDPKVVARFTLHIQNRFQPLRNLDNIVDQWGSFKHVVTEAPQVSVGRRRGSHKEQLIQDRTWAIIDERREAKKRCEPARTEDQLNFAVQRYAELDREVKRSCRADKKKWLENKGIEAQEAADRSDTKTLYRIVHELTGAQSSSSIPIKDKHGKLLYF